MSGIRASQIKYHYNPGLNPFARHYCGVDSFFDESVDWLHSYFERHGTIGGESLSNAIVFGYRIERYRLNPWNEQREWEQGEREKQDRRELAAQWGEIKQPVKDDDRRLLGYIQRESEKRKLEWAQFDARYDLLGGVQREELIARAELDDAAWVMAKNERLKREALAMELEAERKREAERLRLAQEYCQQQQLDRLQKLQEQSHAERLERARLHKMGWQVRARVEIEQEVAAERSLMRIEALEFLIRGGYV